MEVEKTGNLEKPKRGCGRDKKVNNFWEKAGEGLMKMRFRAVENSLVK